jgi:multiple sugar transport system substrate-binding protein
MRFLRLSIAFVLLVNIFLLSSCGSEEEVSKTEDGKKLIEFAVWDYSLAPEYKEAISAFEEKNPDITIEVKDISADEYSDKVSIMLAGGEETDVIAIKDMPSYSGFISKNQIIELDSKISEAGIELENYQGILDDIKLDGKLYQLPYRSDVWLLYYNKGLFDDANEPYPTNDMTFEEYSDIAKRITSGEGNDKIYGTYVHSWKSCVMNWAVANGKGTLIDGDYEFLKPAYEVFHKMQNEDKSTMDFATAKTQNAHYSGQFESGKIGMILMGSWFIGQLITDGEDNKHDLDWGIAKAPHFDDGEEGMTFGNVTGLSINSKSKNQDEAWEFVKFMGTEEGAKYFANRGVLPAYRTDSVMESYLNVEGFPEDNEGALDTSSVKIEFPPSENSAAIDKALQEEHELIMIGENSIDKGIKEMKSRVKEIEEIN